LQEEPHLCISERTKMWTHFKPLGLLAKMDAVPCLHYYNSPSSPLLWVLSTPLRMYIHVSQSGISIFCHLIAFSLHYWPKKQHHNSHNQLRPQFKGSYTRARNNSAPTLVHCSPCSLSKFACDLQYIFIPHLDQGCSLQWR